MHFDSLSSSLLLDTFTAVSRAELAKLLQGFSSLEDCLQADAASWRAAGLPLAAVAALDRARAAPALPDALRACYDRLRSDGVCTIGICDAAYPALLRTIAAPPPWLYVRGHPAVAALPQVAIVGSRKASPAGLRAAGELAADLAATSLCINSGLALGIDAAAHRGALAANGPTVAVMATGIDITYPRRHRELAEAIAESGCLLAEFAPGTPPRRENFPRRNRIISGMALATVVIEASLPSGSLLTAQAALSQGREVMALPWSIYHSGGSGCLQLLRDGATLVQSAADITENLGWYAPPAPRQRDTPAAENGTQRSSLAGKLLASLDDAVATVDDLLLSTGTAPPALMAALGELELAGDVIQVEGGYQRAR